MGDAYAFPLDRPGTHARTGGTLRITGWAERELGEVLKVSALRGWFGPEECGGRSGDVTGAGAGSGGGQAAGPDAPGSARISDAGPKRVAFDCLAAFGKIGACPGDVA